MENVVDFSAIKGDIDIELTKFEARVVAKMVEVRGASGEEIIDGDDGITFGQQSVTKMRSEEAGSAGDQRAWWGHAFLRFLGAEVDWSGPSGETAGRPTL